ncbi:MULTISPECIES: hypothetical protein [Actinoalloteichus]|uniref:Uncharacterized protein n=1 Tax=Actinoalloteichus fjordicus TaxID=1612552 RepID=A0AAC9LBX6_9PSEU|nr:MULTISPECIES: hypothetical protein [Actinoalloteichus]APU13585.1 hypothetical protein UA74_07580 [Actinoalloteichus fjordicus]APU19532.1 hypothetical protein UA75_07565 [Actinoalloteichus sp. GBA129-24]
MTVASVDTVLTDTAVRRLVHDWFEARDRHDHVDNLLRLLTGAGLVLHFPQHTLRSHDDVRSWYEDEILSTYFDEVHEIADIGVQLTSPLHAEVSIRVNWQSRVWRSPKASSTWLGFDSLEHWSVVLQDGMPRIRTYTVRDFTPMPGSASLRADD